MAIRQNGGSPMVSTCEHRSGSPKNAHHRHAQWSLAYAVLAVFLLVAGAGRGNTASAASQDGPPTTTAGTMSQLAAGQEVFQSDCASCHGGQALGGLSFGSVQSADIRGGHLRALQPPYTEGLLSRAIADGVDQRGQALNSAMPRWKGILSPAQTQLVTAYLWSLGAASAGPTTENTHPVPTAPIIEASAMLIVVMGAVIVSLRWNV